MISDKKEINRMDVKITEENGSGRRLMSRALIERRYISAIIKMHTLKNKRRCRNIRNERMNEDLSRVSRLNRLKIVNERCSGVESSACNYSEDDCLMVSTEGAAIRLVLRDKESRHIESNRSNAFPV